MTASTLGPPLTGPEGAVRALAFRDDGRILAAGNGTDVAGTLQLWDTSDPANLRPAGPALKLPTRINAIVYHDQMIAVGSNDGQLRLWDATQPEEPTPVGKPLVGEAGVWINAVAFSSDGRLLVVGSSDTARVWDISSGQAVSQLPHPGPVTGIQFSHNDRLVITNTADGVARLWDLPAPVIKRAQEPISVVAFRPGSNLLAIGSGDLRLWDVAGRRPIPVSPPLNSPPPYGRLSGTVAISPDGKTLASSTREGYTVVLRDITNPRQPVWHSTVLLGPTALIQTVAFSPDGTLLAAGSEDGSVYL